MKKLLAILLMLTLLLPMCGLAEASKTTIRVTTADARALSGVDLNADVLAAIQDAMDALNIEVYAADDASMMRLTLQRNDVFLQGALGDMSGFQMQLDNVPVLGAALEMNDDDLYIGTSFSDSTVYLNVVEDLPRAITAFFQLMNVDLGELPVAAANQSMQQGYRRMQHLLPALAQTPPELLNSIGSSIDWAKMVARINESLPEAAAEAVTNQPDDCDPAVTVLSFALTKEQLIAICSVVLGETLAGLDNLFFGDEMLGGLTDIFCAQLAESEMDGDVPTTVYLDADGGIVKLIITGGAEETEILTRSTNEQGVLYHLSMETTTESTEWEILLNADGVDVSYAVDPKADPERPNLVQSKERMTFRLMNTATENGSTMLVEMHDTEQLCSGGTNWRDETQTDFTFCFNDLCIDGQQEQRTEMTLAKQGQSILTIVAETQPCEVQPLLSESDEIYDLGEMSDERLAAFMQVYTISRFACAICLRLFPSGVCSFHLA